MGRWVRVSGRAAGGGLPRTARRISSARITWARHARLTDVNGNFIDAHDYLPFGEQLEGGTATTHKFTGFRARRGDELDYAKARFLGSSMGRFLSPDPHNAGAILPHRRRLGTHTSNVSNNPLTLTDPTGMMVGADNNGGYGPGEAAL